LNHPKGTPIRCLNCGAITPAQEAFDSDLISGLIEGLTMGLITCPNCNAVGRFRVQRKDIENYRVPVYHLSPPSRKARKRTIILLKAAPKGWDGGDLKVKAALAKRDGEVVAIFTSPGRAEKFAFDLSEEFGLLHPDYFHIVVI
jgi:hypothetical protein